jgi:hypothetical protein
MKDSLGLPFVQEFKFERNCYGPLKRVIAYYEAKKFHNQLIIIFFYYFFVEKSNQKLQLQELISML